MSGYENETHSGHHRYEDSNRPPRGSLSPTHKRRAVAADYFEDDNAQYREDRRTRHHDRSQRCVQDAEGEDSRREHKRRKHHHRHHHHRHHHHDSSSRRHGHNTPPPPAALPFKARLLSYKHDLDAFEPLFANYLDIQKGRDFYSLDAYEQKGRWKSFVNKWNSGQLAEGWYDPEMFERIAKEAPERSEALPPPRDEPVTIRAESYDDDAPEPPLPSRGPERSDNEEDEDDDYGPPPPPGTYAATSSSSRKGPGIPSLADLALQREAAAEAQAAHTADLRLARKADRLQQKEALDELVPRAAPGTRERKLEKKAAVNEKMRSFREKGEAAVEEVDDGDLMGGGDGVDEFKRAMANQQRKKTERELRREEEARARWEEREEKLKEWKAREEEKMKGLKELAKARFG